MVGCVACLLCVIDQLIVSLFAVTETDFCVLVVYKKFAVIVCRSELTPECTENTIDEFVAIASTFHLPFPGHKHKAE